MTTILIAEIFALIVVSLLAAISYFDLTWRKTPRTELCLSETLPDNKASLN